MKNQKEMLEALLSGEHLIGIDERSVNEYWLNEEDGRIYYRNTKEDTFPCKCNGIPNFDKLQVKPKTININGFEVPEPIKHALEEAEIYFTPNLDGLNGENTTFYSWRSDDNDYIFLNRGIIHLTQEAASQHAKALLSFTEKLE